MITFTNEEQEFLHKVVTELYQDANTRQGLGITPDKLLLRFISNESFNDKEVGSLQHLMQEQSEIHGRRSSTANEKQPVVLHSFVPQKTLQLIKSISDKLGASLIVDTETHGDQLSPRSEGSTWIMTDPSKKD